MILNQIDISNALTLFQAAVLRREYTVIKYPKYRETRRRLALTNSDVDDILLSLTVGDYIKGPEVDRDGYSGMFWFFKKYAHGELMYIKFKITPTAKAFLHIDNLEL